MNNPDDPEDDAGLFRKAMSGVTRLNPDADNRYVNQYRNPSRTKSAAGMDSGSIDYDNIQNVAAPVSVDHTDLPGEVLFVRSGIQNKVIRRLKRGELWHDGKPVIDLHGVRGREVEDLLNRFVFDSMDSGENCILVVHGKGMRSASAGGVIRPLATQWLRNSGHVLAFCSAQQRDGGSGAVYVLLKRSLSRG